LVRCLTSSCLALTQQVGECALTAYYRLEGSY
jgi:hypothetical protein